MKKETKVAILGLGGGFLLFWLLQRNVLSLKKEKKPETIPEPSDQDLQVVIAAYADALNNGEDAATLHELNESFREQYKVQVHWSQADGKIMVTDLRGHSIASYDPTVPTMQEPPGNGGEMITASV